MSRELEQMTPYSRLWLYRWLYVAMGFTNGIAWTLAALRWMSHNAALLFLFGIVALLSAFQLLALRAEGKRLKQAHKELQELIRRHYGNDYLPPHEE